MDIAPSKSPQKNDFLKELRGNVVIFAKESYLWIIFL